MTFPLYKRLLPIGLTLALALTLAPQASAEQARSAGEVSKLTQELSQEIYSPYCPGKTLAMCPSGGASKVRQDIQEMASQGLSKQKIKDRVVEEYGEEFRMTPPERGDNITLFILLAAALAVALSVLYVLVRRRSEDSTESTGPLDAPLEEQLSAEDARYLEDVRREYSG